MFSFNLLIFLITSFFLVFVSFLDIKYRSIKNIYILYFLILGILVKIIQSIYLSDISILLVSILTFFLTFLLCYVLWKIGVFAGADLKVFLVIAILNPININLFSNQVLTKPYFFLTLIITSILSMIPFILIYILINVFKKKHILYFKKKMLSKKTLISIFNSLFLLYLINVIINFLNLKLNYILILIFSIAFLILFNKLKNYNIKYYYLYLFIFYWILIILSFIKDTKIFYFTDFLILLLSIVIIYKLFILFDILKNQILVYNKKVYNLKEGDLLYYNYYKKNNKIMTKRLTFFKTIKQFIDGSYHNNLLIDSVMAKGLSKKEVKFLNSLYKDNLIKEDIKLKKTIPFIPAVLIGYLILIFFGDFIWFII